MIFHFTIFKDFFILFFFSFLIFLFTLCHLKKEINYCTVKEKKVQKTVKKKEKKTKRLQSKLHLHLHTTTKKGKKFAKATFNNPLTAQR